MDIEEDKEAFESFRKLYPHLSEAELKEAQQNLDRYIELVLRIYERICEDPVAYARFKAELSKIRKSQSACTHSSN